MKIKITPGQLMALKAVWDRLLQSPPPNCRELLRRAGEGWNLQQLIGFLDRLVKKDVLYWTRGKGNQRLWKPGPMSDYLQDVGLLP